jgi:hypothetical protein
MTKFNIGDLREACEQAGGRWRGLYRGRGFFEGYGAYFDGDANLVLLGVAFERNGIGDLAQHGAHTDSMGRGLVIAWRKGLFNEPVGNEADDPEEEDDDLEAL